MPYQHIFVHKYQKIQFSCSTIPPSKSQQLYHTELKLCIKSSEKEKGQNQQPNYLLKYLRLSTGECAIMFIKNMSSIPITNL